MRRGQSELSLTSPSPALTEKGRPIPIELRPPWDDALIDLSDEDSGNSRGRPKMKTPKHGVKRGQSSSPMPQKRLNFGSPRLKPPKSEVVAKSTNGAKSPNRPKGFQLAKSPNRSKEPARSPLKRLPIPPSKRSPAPPKKGVGGGVSTSFNDRNVDYLKRQAERRKVALKKQMLPDLSPERNEKAISNVRKMIEGFIEAASDKADVDLEQIPLKEESIEEGEDKKLINLEIASRRLVNMAQKGDWIAFDQSLK